MIWELVGGIKKNTWRGMITTIMPKHKVLYLYVKHMCSVHGLRALWAIMFLLQCSGSCALLVSSFHIQSWRTWRHTSNQDLAINPIFKCDECTYIAFSWTILKHRTTMTHPNKDEPRPRGSSCWFLLFTDRAGKVKTHLLSGPYNIFFILIVMNAATWPSPDSFKTSYNNETSKQRWTRGIWEAFFLKIPLSLSILMNKSKLYIFNI